MKFLLDGSAFISFIILIIITSFAFIVNKQHKTKDKKTRIIEKRLKNKLIKNENIYIEKIKELEKENEKINDEFEDHKKLNDPFWCYYDEESEEFKTLPGKYGVDEPINKPK